MSEETCEKNLLKEDFIDKLIAEPKYIRSSKKNQFALTTEKSHRKASIQLESKYNFKMNIRQSIRDPFNFSVILLYASSNKNSNYRILVRYNGDHGSHTNSLEGNTVKKQHIHRTTERYQLSQLREDGYAEETDKYVTLDQAINEFMKDMNISYKGPEQVPRIETWSEST